MMPHSQEMQISSRVQGIPQAMSIYLNQLVYDLKRRGQDVVTLSLGEAFFDIPLFDFKKLDINKCYHYSDSRGIPELRHKIAEFYRKHYNAPVDADTEIMITAGSKPAIFMAMQTVVNPGEEVLIHEPAWLSYEEQARLVDAVPRFIPFDHEPGKFDEHYGKSTRMLVISNPNNPAGRLYRREDLELIYRQCRERGIYVLVDEAYSDFVTDEPFVSMAEVAPERDGVIVVNSLSKNMGISGWRVGYAISNPKVIDQLLKVNQHIITCAPSILLYYLARYFDQITAITLPQVRQVVEKRERVGAMMDELGLQRLGGASTFYFFVSIEDFPGTSLDYALHLLLNNAIAVVPGSAYGPSTGRFVRVSIGTESEERIWESLAVMKDLIETKGCDPEDLKRKLADLGFAPIEEPDNRAVPANRMAAAGAGG